MYILFQCIILFMLKKWNEKSFKRDLLEKQEFSKLYAWLYSIYNQQPQFENLISFYEKLCSLNDIRIY